MAAAIVTIYQQGDDNDAFNNGNSAFRATPGRVFQPRPLHEASEWFGDEPRPKYGNRNSSEFLDQLRHSGNVATLTCKTGDWNSVDR